MNYKLEHDTGFAEDVLVAPLTKFNTPAGSVVRHCWLKELVTPLVIHELLEHFSDK
jgi:hypothetical protein